MLRASLRFFVLWNKNSELPAQKHCCQWTHAMFELSKKKRTIPSQNMSVLLCPSSCKAQVRAPCWITKLINMSGVLIALGYCVYCKDDMLVKFSFLVYATRIHLRKPQKRQKNILMITCNKDKTEITHRVFIKLNEVKLSYFPGMIFVWFNRLLHIQLETSFTLFIQTCISMSWFPITRFECVIDQNKPNECLGVLTALSEVSWI